MAYERLCFVDETGLKEKKVLNYWTLLYLDFNSRAKALKNKEKIKTMSSVSTKTHSMTHKEHKRMTITELRGFKGFENYCDREAQETISTLEKLSILFYKAHMKKIKD